MQKQSFIFQSFCSNILYHALGEDKTEKTGELYDSDQIHAKDVNRIISILEKIIG